MSDVLGILIAFVSVMLLLSMLVTGLVQGTQAALRLRSRNLLVGVAAIMTEAVPPGGERGTAQLGGEPSDDVTDKGASDVDDTDEKSGILEVCRRVVRNKHKQRAALMLNSSSVALVDQVTNANSWGRILFGPTVSWVDPKVLLNELAPSAAKTGETAEVEVSEEGATTAELNAQSANKEASSSGKNGDGTAEASKELAYRSKLEQRLEGLGPALSRRFQFFIRLITIFWAVVVAAAYQVSAPALFSSLANGDTPTAPFVENLDRLLELGEGPLADSGYLDLIAQSALDALAARFPEDSSLIAEVGTGGATREQLIAELSDVVSNSPRGAELVQTYGTLLDQMTGVRDEAILADVSTVVGQLAAFDIEFWREGSEFYVERSSLDELLIHWDALFGVLLTAILLTFGAPFWFEQLRNLAALRDLRSGNARKSGSTNERQPLEITELGDGSRRIRMT